MYGWTVTVASPQTGCILADLGLCCIDRRPLQACCSKTKVCYSNSEQQWSDGVFCSAWVEGPACFLWWAADYWWCPNTGGLLYRQIPFLV